MGQSESKHSQKTDALPNLQWALWELMLWRTKCDPLARIGNLTSEVPPGTCVPTMPGAPPVCAPSSTSSGTLAAAGPDATCAGQPTSSVSGVSTDVTSPGGMSTTSSAQSIGSSGISGDEKSPTEGALRSARELQEEWAGPHARAPPGGPSLAGAEESGFDEVALDAADARHLRHKYQFIHEHLQKLVKAGEDNYMMLIKEQFWKSQQSKINLAQPNGPTLRAEIDKKLTENTSELTKKLGDFDNARMAVQWLERHFDLLIQRRNLCIEIRHISNRIGEIQSQAAHPSDESLDEIRRLRHRSAAAHASVTSAMQNARQLRRESLAVGLQYLDVNLSGSIEPEDQPLLSAELFSRLDVRNRHKINTTDLQQAVDKMEKGIETYNTRINNEKKELEKIQNDRDRVLESFTEPEEKRLLRAEELALECKKKNQAIQLLTQDRDREEALLRETYTLFQRAFVDSLFAKLSGRPEEKARYDALGGDLESMETDMKHLHIAAGESARTVKSQEGRKKSSPLLFGRHKSPTPPGGSALAGVARSASSGSPVLAARKFASSAADVTSSAAASVMGAVPTSSSSSGQGAITSGSQEVPDTVAASGTVKERDSPPLQQQGVAGKVRHPHVSPTDKSIASKAADRERDRQREREVEREVERGSTTMGTSGGQEQARYDEEGPYEQQQLRGDQQSVNPYDQEKGVVGDADVVPRARERGASKLTLKEKSKEPPFVQAAHAHKAPLQREREVATDQPRARKQGTTTTGTGQQVEREDEEEQHGAY